MIRCAFASALDPIGLVGRPAPVAGSTRRIDPLSTRGYCDGRPTLWDRIEPPIAVGDVSFVPTPPGGSPQGLTGVYGWPPGASTVPPPWPKSCQSKLAPSPAET